MSNSLIKVIGVGGGGCNAVNHMYIQGIRQVDFVVANTDYQALANSPVAHKIQLGKKLTEGRGAGNQPEQGKLSAIEEKQELVQFLSNGTKMVFITAGMGGGTGTGAAPVIAEIARELGVLCVGIVSLPFRFEGQKRFNQALAGIEQIKEYVDSLLIIKNEKLREIYGDLTLTDAFIKADNVLTMAAKGIAEMITVHGYINVDFADVETVMRNSGMALMGSARARGEHRAMTAVQEALKSPLLNNNNIYGARNILMNITSGADEVTMSEIGLINDYVQDCAGQHATIIWGNGSDESLGDDIQVTVIATGFSQEVLPELARRNVAKPQVFNLTQQHPGKQQVQEKPASQIQSVRQMPASQNQSVRQPAAEMPASQGQSVRQPAAEMPANQGQSVRQPAAGYSDSIISRQKVESSIRNENTDESSRLVSFQQAYREAQSLDEFEAVPAYKRRGLHLESPAGTGKSNVSRYSLNEDADGNIILRKNSWLHDKVD